MLELFRANISSVILVALIIVGLGILLYIGKVAQVKKIALSLVLMAEDKFGPKSGSEKYNYVLGLLYSRLPVIVRIFMTEKQLSALIEEAVIAMKKKLAEE